MKVYNRCAQLLDDKINSLKELLYELGESSKNDTKSSAGDKHETGRAIIQREQESIGKQLKEILKQRTVFEKINPAISSAQIAQGSLIYTNHGCLYISIPIGRMIVDEISIMAISSDSPIAIKLIGLQVNDTAEINGLKYKIEKMY